VWFSSVAVDSLYELLFNLRIGEVDRDCPKEDKTMAEKKEPMGFATPARELEYALVQILGELSGKKANWESLRNSMLHLMKKTADNINTGNTSSEQYTLLSTTAIAAMVARLGIELAESHERLAKVEKAIRESKLGR